MSYFTSSINESATIALEAGAALNEKAFYAVEFDSSGKAVLATGSGIPLGVLVSTTPEEVAAGDIVDVQIKDGTALIISGDVDAGEQLTIASGGKAAVATSGQYVFALALESGGAGDIIRAQIVHSGKA